MPTHTEIHEAIDRFKVPESYDTVSTMKLITKFHYLNPDLKSEPRVAIVALRAIVRAQYMLNKRDRDESVILWFYRVLPEDLKNSYDFILQAQSVHGLAFRLASDSVLEKNAYHLILLALNPKYDLIMHSDSHERMASDKQEDLCFTDVVFSLVPKTLFLEISFILAVLKKYPQHLKYMYKENPAAVNSLKCERNLSATCKYMRQVYNFFGNTYRDDKDKLGKLGQMVCDLPRISNNSLR